MININGNFKMLNAAGRVTKSRDGFMPVTDQVIRDRVKRAKSRIRALESAIRDMNGLLTRNGYRAAA